MDSESNSLKSDQNTTNQDSVFEQTPDYSATPSMVSVEDALNAPGQPIVAPEENAAIDVPIVAVGSDAPVPHNAVVSPSAVPVEPESQIDLSAQKQHVVTPVAPDIQPEKNPESIVSEAKPMETNQVGTPSRSTKLADIGKQHHEQHNIIAILISIVVVIGLVAIGYLAYSGDDSDDDNSGSQSAQIESSENADSVQQQNIAPIDSAQLDEDTEQIDSLIEEIDAIDDLEESDISDEGLGL